jgi:hypothetical protein
VEFFRVWQALSPSQRGYLSTPMVAFWFFVTFGISVIGDPTNGDSAPAMILIGVGCAGFASILYVAVRSKALTAFSEGRELQNDAFAYDGMGVKLKGVSGSPRKFRNVVAVLSVITFVMILGSQGLIAGLATLLLLSGTFAYISKCAKSFAH